MYVRHASIPRDTVTFLSSQLEPLLRLPHANKRNKHHAPLTVGTGEEQHAHVTNVLDELSKQIRALKDFPLVITSVQGTEPVFRGAEVGVVNLKSSR